MSKHTPGPWQRDGSHIYGPDPKRKLICQLHYDGALSEEAGNESLIAAAPELYAGCAAALNMVDGNGAPPDWDWLRRIIAKAEGQSIGSKDPASERGK